MAERPTAPFAGVPERGTDLGEHRAQLDGGVARSRGPRNLERNMTVRPSADRSHPAPWHAIDAGEALRRLGSSEEGLSQAEALVRLGRYGPNELPRAKREGALVLLWRQIHNPLIWVLLGAAALALITGKAADSLVVLAAVVLNTLIGFVQELKASRSIEALSRLVPERALAMRDQRKLEVFAQELVPGDVVLLSAGDRVPADMRLVRARGLHVEEAALTGESVPVAKSLGVVAPEAELGDRTSMVFGGTVVASGSALALVVATGERTELGRIAHLLHEATKLETPLTRQLATLGRAITFAVISVSALLLPMAVLRGYDVGDALLVAIALAVAAVPEGLPAVVTIALALGVQRMARRRAIVRQLPAVETLGSTTVICTDKTGTLTRNEMTVQALWTPAGSCALSGTGYSPKGRLLGGGGEALPEPPEEVRALLVAAVLCSDAALYQRGGESAQIAGDPTEGALVVAATKVGLDVDELRRRYPRRDVVPFESERRYMAVLHDFPGQPRIVLKGAPETVVSLCDLPPWLAAEDVRDVVEALGGRGMRVLAVAERPTLGTADLSPEQIDRGGFRLLGLQGMFDPPRPEAIAAVRACREAGVDVKMVTGDHPLTARAIGAELGLGEAPVITGSELGALDDARLRERVQQTQVFARVAPEHKLRLVRALQADFEVVAMTGDGVNDAPALKQANIGVAMGITGTAVAKQAADVVLIDDNFASIAAAVEEGRRVYDNLIKSFAFILPTNLGLALVLVVAVAAFPMQGGGGELAPLLPLLPKQILWVNLVASVTLSFPLALEVAESDVMRRPPRRPDEPVLGTFLVFRTAVVATLMAAGGIGLFLWEYGRSRGILGYARALAEAQTMAVTTIVMFQVFYMLNCRSLRESVWKIGSRSNPSVFVGIALLLLLQAAFVYLPFMQEIFETASLSPRAVGVSALAGAVVLPVITFEKALRARRRTRGLSREAALPRRRPREA